MTQVSTTLTITWPSQILNTTQETNLQATVASALTGQIVVYLWHSDNLDVTNQLPAVDTPTAADVDVVCPACQAEFKLGSSPL